LESECNGSIRLKSAFKKMIPMFIEETPLKMEALRQALDRADVEMAAKAAHGLVGTAGVMKATRTAEYARSLESAARNKDIAKARRVFRELDEEIREVLAILSKYHHRLVCETDNVAD
jgi:HPt (histidine-containing phosphotransfer) domain-containing protein